MWALSKLLKDVLVERSVRRAGSLRIIVQLSRSRRRPHGRGYHSHSAPEGRIEVSPVAGVRFEAIDLSRGGDAEDRAAVAPNVRPNVENDACSPRTGSVITS